MGAELYELDEYYEFWICFPTDFDGFYGFLFSHGLDGFLFSHGFNGFLRIDAVFSRIANPKFYASWLQNPWNGSINF